MSGEVMVDGLWENTIAAVEEKDDEQSDNNNER